MVKQVSRKITLRVPESKYSFLLELLENLEFVELEEPSKEQLLHEIKQSFQEVKMMEAGKLPKKTARELLHEL
jgi:hypothetical protein